MLCYSRGCCCCCCTVDSEERLRALADIVEQGKGGKFTQLFYSLCFSFLFFFGGGIIGFWTLERRNKIKIQICFRTLFSPCSVAGSLRYLFFLCNLLKWDLPYPHLRPPTPPRLHHTLVLHLAICCHGYWSIAPGRCLTRADGRQRHFISPRAPWFTESLQFMSLRRARGAVWKCVRQEMMRVWSRIPSCSLL